MVTQCGTFAQASKGHSEKTAALETHSTWQVPRSRLVTTASHPSPFVLFVIHDPSCEHSYHLSVYPQSMIQDSRIRRNMHVIVPRMALVRKEPHSAVKSLSKYSNWAFFCRCVLKQTHSCPYHLTPTHLIIFVLPPHDNLATLLIITLTT